MSIQPRWRKVLRDLWGNKVRTLLVVLSIAIGVFAIGMILSADVLLRQDLTRGYLDTQPASATLFVSPFQQDLVDTVRRVPGVAAAEGRRTVSMRVEVGPEQYKTLSIDAMDDFGDAAISVVALEAGVWPPEDGGLALERASLPLVNAAIGGRLAVERPDGKLRELPIDGTVHDVTRMPSRFTGDPVGFVTMTTLEQLGYDRSFSKLLIRAADPSATRADLERLTDEVQDKVERAGYIVYRTRVTNPGEHPVQEIVDPMLLILGTLGALSLFASSFLVINIINGLLSQQTQQIGIMKAVGARRGQIVAMYLVAIVLLGAIALVLAIPAAGAAAYGFTRYIAGLINFDLGGFRIPVRAVAIMVVVGLLVPLLAGLAPVLSGSRLTVRQALSTYGLGTGRFGTSVLDRLITLVTRLLRLSRPMQISLRNTIRRKARLLLTLITLTLGGSIFIGIVSVHASLLKTLDEALAYFAYDVELSFDRPYRMEELASVANQVPGVAEVDSWVGTSAYRERPDGSQGDDFSVLGALADTRFIQPKMLAGRWLRPDDTNAIVINTDIAEDESDVTVGDMVVLSVDGRESEWQVVGLTQAVMIGPIAYVNRPYLERELRQVGQSDSLQVIATNQNPAAWADLAVSLREAFKSQGFQVGTAGTIVEIRDRVEYQFNLVVVFLAIMAVLIAAVGGLGLMGTMSINVLERTREIGVMRAVGASDGSVLRIVLVEGVFVGVISWALAAVLGYPMGRILSDLVGNSLLDSPLSFQYAFNGALAWLVAVLAIAAFASIFPAWRAARLSVQQTLAYE